MAGARLRLPVWRLSFLVLATLVLCSAKDVVDCSCGFYDPVTQELFTDSAIVYFNETTHLPAKTFIPEVYENKYEKGWNSRFRQGFNPSNIVIDPDQTESNSSLQLWVDPSTPEHLVVGGAVQTPRRDIFYGSFRALMRSPHWWIPGSALSMTLYYNDSQTINLDMNVPSETQAWVSMLSHGEFPDRDLGVNYSVLSNSTYGMQPWDFIECRIDWSEKEIKFYIGGQLFRTILKNEAKNFPQTPTALRLKHWSVGNYFTMQGPPTNHSEANVGWVRTFFNSSLTTEQDQRAFAQRCSLSDACATEDMSLRGNTPYEQVSEFQWSQAPNSQHSRKIPIIILIITGAVSAFLIVNAMVRRIPRRKKLHGTKGQTQEKTAMPSHDTSTALTPQAAIVISSAPALANDSGIASRFDSRAASNYPSRAASQFGSRAASLYGGMDTPRPAIHSRGNSLSPYIHIQMDATSPSQFGRDQPKRPRLSWREFSERIQKVQLDESGQYADRRSRQYEEDASVYDGKDSESSSLSGKTHFSANNLQGDTELRIMTERDRQPASNRTPTVRAVELYARSESDICSCTEEQTLRAALNLGAAKTRIDYLAGLLSFACVLVTAIQFTLTFSPASITPGADIHYKAENWARKVVSAYFLNLVWVGPFLITSARFLVTDYLEHGDLLVIARKIVSRPFRLLLPVLAIAMLEYFFMDSGAVNWLEYLPSVTWSTWPFTIVPNNFGYFLSEILELAYLIPNAAPQITFNYCTGVLWTIPVQLQNSWVALLGVIVVRQIKTPWKRFGYYTFCMLMHWYALSWGSYFWFGIMLVDLEITYNYRKSLQARPVLLYTLVFVSLCMTAGGLSLDMVTQLTQVNYADYEYGVHPDIPTGLPIMWTGATGYPQYYVPKLNGIVFAFGLQALVELSPLVQSLFSWRVLLYIYPHIYTIYLIHGFIFWSLGSTVFIYLSTHGYAYWAMVAVVAVCCYGTLFLSMHLLTPIVNTLGNGDNIWIFAHEVPSPRRPTLYPFPTNFLFVRQEVTEDVAEAAESGEVPAVLTKSRGRFRTFTLRLVNILAPKLHTQTCQPVSQNLSRTNSVRGPGVPPRSVGWRTGGLPKSVVMLRRNNSIGSRARS